MKYLVTGGAGFIGSALVRDIVDNTADSVVNVDKLTYAGHLESVASVADSDRYAFEKADICDSAAMTRIFREHAPDAVMHLAAESHVDRSIDGPAAFVQTNLVGTFTLLELAHAYWRELEGDRHRDFRFLHVSTDEVFGDLGDSGFFVESTPYAPSSPYSATKAGSDHLVRAWHRTYGLPVVVTNCSNNYGPYHYPEKLIPLIILNALDGRPLPVYGKGEQVRDWLYVEDHVDALRHVVQAGRVGETYNVGGNNAQKNIDVVRAVCALLDERVSERPSGVQTHAELIEFVADRPGHDQRYAIDATKLAAELGWSARETFESGLRKTVDWYLKNLDWCEEVQKGRYDRRRLGRARGAGR